MEIYTWSCYGYTACPVPEIERSGSVRGPKGRHSSMLSGWLLLLFFAWMTAGATEVPQYSSWNCQVYTCFPNQVVRAIVQTQDGYLWVGTQYGLARFDGMEFTIFNRNN